MVDIAKIEQKVDHAITAETPVDKQLGGLSPETLGQVMEFAKLMAVGGAAVPKWLRGNPGGCLMICTRAMRWGMDPYGVAEQTYITFGRGGEERVNYMSGLVHAVVETRAPLKGRLRHEIVGEGDERRCKVWGTFKGEASAHEYTSLTLRQLLDNRPTIKDSGGKKGGSPLWESRPEVQMFYSTTTQWARLFCPDVLLGVYTEDDFSGGEVVDVSASITGLAQRLKDARATRTVARGFDPGHAATVIEGEAPQATEAPKDGPAPAAGPGKGKKK